MKQIDQHIVELVLRYERVILPKLGCLIKSIEFTTSKSHTFSKEENLSFEQNSKLNDGMLYKYVSLKLNISLIESQNIVDQYISDLKIRIFNQEHVALDPLGEFTLADDESITFSYNVNFRIFPEYNGLNAFKRQPIIRQDKLIVEKTTKTSRKWYWATAGLIPLLGLSIYFGINRQKPDNFATPTTAGLSEISTTITIPTLDLTKLKEVNFDGLYEETEENLYFFAKANKPQKGYQIVLGVFGDKANALKLAKLNNTLSKDMIIAPYKGMYKVSTSVYNSKRQAQTDLALVRKSNPKAWLLKSK